MDKHRMLLTNLSGGVSDTVRPTVTITSSEVSPTIAATIPITITFSESVTGFVVGDITISAGSLGALGGSGAVYTVTWTPPAEGGALTMDIAQGVAADAAGNTNTAATQFAMTVYGAETTTTLQPDGTAGFDSFIDKSNVNTNNGTNTDMYVGGLGATNIVRPVIKFDASSIPSTAHIVSATLSLWEETASDTAGTGSWAVELHRLLRNWVEAQVTWNVYATSTNWGTAGAGIDGVDAVVAASASVTMDGTAAANFVDFSGATMLDDVRKFINGTYNNYGWIITAPAAENKNVSFNKFKPSDFATAARRPKLVVVHRNLP